MKEEKMMILSMLQEGKITPEEAVKLIEAIEDLEVPYSKSEFNSQKDNNEDKDKYNRVLNKTLDEIGSDISSAFSNIFNGLKDLGSSIGINNNSSLVTIDLEKDISNIANPIIDLKSVNGSVTLRKNNSQSISIKVICQYKNGLLDNNREFFKFYTEGNRVVFTPLYNSDISIKLEVSLPTREYDEININSTNGKIIIEDIKTNLLYGATTNGSIVITDVKANDTNLSTKNGKIDCNSSSSNIFKLATTNSSINLLTIRSKNIEAYTANSRITIKDVDSNSVKCKTSNGSIDATDISSEVINLTASNGKIICDGINYSKARDVKLITSNGSISSELSGLNQEAYLDLETSMGNINLELSNLIYITNKQINLGIKKIVAHSINYNEDEKYLNFTASTSNGSIKIS